MSYDNWKLRSREEDQELRERRARYHKRGTPPRSDDDSPEAQDYWDRRLDERLGK